MIYRNHTFIVRDFSNKGKYLINTKDLTAALKIHDEARRNGTPADLSCKNKASYLKNQLMPVPQDWIDEARQEM